MKYGIFFSSFVLSSFPSVSSLIIFFPFRLFLFLFDFSSFFYSSVFSFVPSSPLIVYASWTFPFRPDAPKYAWRSWQCLGMRPRCPFALACKWHFTRWRRRARMRLGLIDRVGPSSSLSRFPSLFLSLYPFYRIFVSPFVALLCSCLPSFLLLSHLLSSLVSRHFFCCLSSSFHPFFLYLFS